MRRKYLKICNVRVLSGLTWVGLYAIVYAVPYAIATPKGDPMNQPATIAFSVRTEYEMSVQPVGIALAALVAGLNSGEYEVSDSEEATVVDRSGKVVGEIWAMGPTAADFVRSEFVA